MTEPPEVPPLDIDAELAALVARRIRRRAWLAQAAAEHHAARRRGLAHRHAARLRRARERNQHPTGDDQHGEEHQP